MRIITASLYKSECTTFSKYASDSLLLNSLNLPRLLSSYVSVAPWYHTVTTLYDKLVAQKWKVSMNECNGTTVNTTLAYLRKASI